MSLRIGSIGYATNQGLGILAKSFVDSGLVTNYFVLLHAHRPSHLEWFPSSPKCHVREASAGGLRNIKQFCKQQHVMLFFETPHVWELLPYCRQHKVTTVLMPMYECLPYYRELPSQPDYFLCPSMLDLQYFPDRSVYLPVPVDMPWRLRQRAELFVHHAGHGGLRGRNGTKELLEALRYVTTPARFLITAQKSSVLGDAEQHLPPDVRSRVEFRKGTAPHGTLWDEGDVCVHPSKFDGLSLPLQEARAAGMLVMTTDRKPFNEWLPTDVPKETTQSHDGKFSCTVNGNPLIPVERYDRARVAGRCVEFDEAVLDPRAMAAKIDEWHGKDIREYSEQGREWAEANSWQALMPCYQQTLAQIREETFGMP